MLQAHKSHQLCVFCFCYCISILDESKNETQDITADLVQGFVHSVNVDINELTNQNKCIDLQHTFRPIFVQFFKTNLYHRYKAVTFRRVLAEKGFDLKTLEDIWNDKKKVRSFERKKILFLSNFFRFFFFIFETFVVTSLVKWVILRFFLICIINFLRLN